MTSPMRIHVLTNVRCKRRIDGSYSFNFVGVTAELAIVECFMDIDHSQVSEHVTIVLNGCKLIFLGNWTQQP